MKHLTLAATALSLAAGAAHAGSVMRDGDRSQILFEEGKNYFEFTVTTVSPDVKGTVAGGALGSGNMQLDFQNYTFGYKHQMNEKLSFALFTSNPVGADVSYAPGTPYPFSGSNAELDSLALTALAKYNVTDRVSVYGGPRLQSLSGNLRIMTAGLPLPPLYTLTVDKDYRFGYVVGAAYQIPDIKMKVALTYESEIKHKFHDNTGTPFNVKVPQAVTLHARSGIAKDTLLFGSVRWQEWTAFEIRPRDFTGGIVPIASEASDIWTYEVGVGRRFSDTWSGAFTIGYEKDQGDIVGNLSGKDGYTSYGLAMKYQTEHWEITTGVKYFDIGGAITGIGANFTGSSALAGGIKIGLRF